MTSNISAPCSTRSAKRSRPHPFALDCSDGHTASSSEGPHDEQPDVALGVVHVGRCDWLDDRCTHGTKPHRLVARHIHGCLWLGADPRGPTSGGFAPATSVVLDGATEQNHRRLCGGPARSPKREGRAPVDARGPFSRSRRSDRRSQAVRETMSFGPRSARPPPPLVNRLCAATNVLIPLESRNATSARSTTTFPSRSRSLGRRFDPFRPHSALAATYGRYTGTGS